MVRISESPLPPRILFATASLAKGSGGIAELSRQVFGALLEMQRQEDARVEVHVLDDEGPGRGDALFAEPELPAMRWHAGSRWRFAWASVASPADLRLFDHVGLARLAAALPRAFNHDYFALVHGVELLNGARPDYVRAARRARGLIANSEYTAHRVRSRHAGLPAIRVCRPGKDDVRGDVSSAGAAAGPPVDGIGDHAMLIVGRLSAAQRHKGHDHLIETLPSILKTVPDAQLVVAGDGDDRARLERKAAELSVGEHVLFTGWVDEDRLASLYEQCAVFVMPSDGDGFGMVFLEAMMSRTPCVGLRGGAAQEILVDGESGILVDREDRGELAAVLGALLLDDGRRARLGRAGYERYRAEFTHRHFADRLRSILMAHC